MDNGRSNDIKLYKAKSYSRIWIMEGQMPLNYIELRVIAEYE